MISYQSIVPKAIKETLSNHLINATRFTHLKREEDNWLFFNVDTCTGFEVYHLVGGGHYLRIWECYTPDKMQYALHEATPI